MLHQLCDLKLNLKGEATVNRTELGLATTGRGGARQAGNHAYGEEGNSGFTVITKAGRKKASSMRREKHSGMRLQRALGEV